MIQTQGKATHASQPAIPQPARRFYSTAEVLAILMVSRSTFYATYIDQGLVRRIKVGSKSLYAADEIDQLADGIAAGTIVVATRPTPTAEAS